MVAVGSPLHNLTNQEPIVRDEDNRDVFQNSIHQENLSLPIHWRKFPTKLSIEVLTSESSPPDSS